METNFLYLFVYLYRAKAPSRVTEYIFLSALFWAATIDTLNYKKSIDCDLDRWIAVPVINVDNLRPIRQTQPTHPASTADLAVHTVQYSRPTQALLFSPENFLIKYLTPSSDSSVGRLGRTVGRHAGCGVTMV
ncbi:hypothetical protein BpHYR1_022637 [Brachionus plicatilis]|uniref:Uncharacterized protein n=1 Tax=Brachionus plicatilis TaxID=10195 RepID=A0A3M7Q5Q9_BRAPC|nr:hypothetical protein BpHYR1_022637 [Brachionus plicatilis]